MNARRIISISLIFIVVIPPIHAQFKDAKSAFGNSGVVLNYSNTDNHYHGTVAPKLLSLDSLRSDTVLNLKTNRSEFAFQIRNSFLRSLVLALEPNDSDEDSSSHDGVYRSVNVFNTDFSRSLFITGIKSYIWISDGNIDGLTLIGCNECKVRVSEARLGELTIFNTGLYQDVYRAFITLDDVYLAVDSKIEGYIDTIQFGDVEIKNGSVLKINNYEKTVLAVGLNVDIRKINFDYNRVEIQWLGQKVDKRNVLETVKQMQRENNYAEGLKKADVELTCLNLRNGNWLESYIVLPIRENWNYFGYKKTLIIRNTIVLFGVFLILNFIFFNTLVEKVTLCLSVYTISHWSGMPWLFDQSYYCTINE